MEVIIRPQDGGMSQQPSGAVLLCSSKQGDSVCFCFTVMVQLNCLTQAFFCEFYCRHSRFPHNQKRGLFKFESLHLSKGLNHNQDPDTTWWPPPGPRPTAQRKKFCLA